MRLPIIIAIILIVVGLLLSLSALLMVNFDVHLLSSVKYEEKTAPVAETFRDIAIHADTYRVNILPAEDGSVRVVYHEPLPEDMTVSVSVKDGKLSVVEEDTRKWYQKISIFNSVRQQITVYLPAGTYGALDIALSTGDVVVEKDFTFASAVIAQSTGDLLFKASVTGEVDITGSTGDRYLSGSYGSLKLKGRSGDVRLSDLTVHGSLEIKRSTGDIFIERSAAGEVSLQVRTGDIEADTLTVAGNMSVVSTTGEVELAGTVVGAHLEICSTTGDVELEGSDAATLKITTDTGDVSGWLLTDKTYIAKAKTGDVRVPDTVGGICEINIDTGDIDFRSKN